jgi:hypothetical protein
VSRTLLRYASFITFTGVILLLNKLFLAFACFFSLSSSVAWGQATLECGYGINSTLFVFDLTQKRASVVLSDDRAYRIPVFSWKVVDNFTVITATNNTLNGDEEDLRFIVRRTKLGTTLKVEQASFGEWVTKYPRLICR